MAENIENLHSQRLKRDIQNNIAGTIELTIDDLQSQKTQLLESFKKLQTQQNQSAKELQAK